MHVVTTKIPDELYSRLENLAKVSDRTKSYLVKKAVMNFLDEKEDYFIALSRLEAKNPRYSIDYLKEDNSELED
ncbi:MAG UNVERIFIED_CONTAM: ribbon-helix-helix domain-containing protein [Rickettsiaceae bacterium]|jgi:RHH-type rel operon transcriptional repressor/antitoxin RelB